MINAKENLIGEISEKNTLIGEVNVSKEFISPPLINLEINPTKEKQVFNHDGFYGYDNVVINEVTSTIDENIQPNNIKSGTSILGVVGTLQEGYLISVDGDSLLFSQGNVKEGELIL